MGKLDESSPDQGKGGATRGGRRESGLSGLLLRLLSLLCLLWLLFLLIRMTMAFATPSPAHRLLLVADIPLPGAFANAARQHDPLAPGVAVLFDHFDFQTLDPRTHLLFIAHTGPNPDREAQINRHFNAERDARNDGNVVIFNTLQRRVVGLLPIPQVTGMVAAPDLHKVYAADSNDDTIYAIDEATLHLTAIHLQPHDSPDGMTYDSSDHLVFVSNPGSPANPDQSNVVARKNQNETAINALTDRVVKVIPLGIDGRWGDDVGHVRFDAALHRIFVVVQQVPDPDDPHPNVLPPPGTAMLVEIDPLHLRVVRRVMFAYHCLVPHGLEIDIQQQLASIACVDSNPPSLYRVDLRTLRTLPGSYPLAEKPDMLAQDRPLHLLYVACGAGIVMFSSEGRALHWLGTYTFGVNTHTLAVNEETHEIYVPLIRMGGRPVLRIMRYNPAGTV